MNAREHRYQPAPLPHRAAAYVRVSDPSQAAADKTSPQTQEAACRAAALRDGYPAVVSEHVYCDGLENRASGEELYQRPALDRLRADARHGAFSMVYINSVERLARDAIHQGIVIAELAESGVSVEFVAEPLKLDTLEGQVLSFMKAYSGKVENERKRERQLRAIQARAAKGLPIRSCRPPYGFAWGPEVDAHGRPTYARWVFDPVTAPIRRRLFTELAGGATLRDLAYRLTQEGIPTPTQYAWDAKTPAQRETVLARRVTRNLTGLPYAAGWNASTVRTLVSEPLCWGDPVALRSQTEQLAPNVRKLYKYKSRSVPRPPAERVPLPPGILPPDGPLVTSALAASVAERLAHNKAASVRRNPDPDATLLRGGLAVCGACGHPLMVWRDQGSATRPANRVRYRCRYGARTRQQGCRSHSIEAPKLDVAVWERIADLLRNPALIRTEVARMQELERSGEQPGAGILAAIETQIADLTRRIRNKRSYAENVHDEQEQREVAEEVDLLASRRRELERERLAATAHYGDWQQREAELTGAVAWAEQIGRVESQIALLSQHEKREWLEALRVEVQVYPVERPGPEGKRVWLTVQLPVSGKVALQLATDVGDSATVQNVVP